MSFKHHLFAMGSVIALMTGAAPAFAYNNKAYIAQPGSVKLRYPGSAGPQQSRDHVAGRDRWKVRPDPVGVV